MAKPIEEEYGGLVGSKPRPKKKRGPNPVPVRPSAPPKTPTSPPKTVATPTRSGGGGGGKRAGAAAAPKKSGGGGGGGAAGYEKRAIARENRAKRKAADRAVEQAKTLEAQAHSLQLALRKSLGKARDQQLSDIKQGQLQQGALIREGYNLRADSLKGAAEDNEKAEAGQSGINAGNILRERGDAIAEIMSLGAGESDSLQAQLMSLRNWHANQTEVNRGYYDTLRSVNSSLTDLNVDTKSALANNQIQANADREQVWTNFYDSRSETLTQLGNVRGQQADLFNQAVEMGRASAAGEAKKAGAKKAAEQKKKGPDKKAAASKAGRPGNHPLSAKNQPKPAARAAAGRDRDQEDERRRFSPVPTNEFRKGNGGRGTPKAQTRNNHPSGKSAAQRQRERQQQQAKEQRQADRRFINRTADNAAEANRQSRNAFTNAARTRGMSWDNPGVGDGVMDWDGRKEFEAAPTTLSKIQAARTVSLGKRPEGATLRKW